jgi:Zn finger protein HypA/HybF involved in hydrogenase expression
MAASALCPTCQRNVYMKDGDTQVCPVCSSPLLETVEPDEISGQDQMEGTK